MFFAPLFLTLDIVIFSILQKWTASTLLAYCIYVFSYNAKQSPRSPAIIISLILLAMLDTLIFGRFGISLLYFIPLLFLAQKGRELFGKSIIVPTSLGLIAIICQEVIIKTLVLGRFFNLRSTLNILFVTILLVICMVKIFETMGVRGNRSCA